jgi:hypothetical protein
MADFQLDAPGLAKIAAQVAMILRAGPDLRDLQGRNAALTKYFDQPGVFSNVGSVSVTGNVVYKIAEVQQRQGEIYSALVLVFETSSGSGRYRVDGPPPSPTVGSQVPAGGVVITIPGYESIRNFALMAEALQTLVFSRYLIL